MRDNLAEYFTEQPKSFRKKDTLFQEGAPANRLYLVKEGRVKLGRSDPDTGEELISSFVSGIKPVLIGTEALGNPTGTDLLPNYSTDATAIEPVRAQIIQSGDVKELIKLDPDFALSITRNLVSDLQGVTDRIHQQRLPLPSRLALSIVYLSEEWVDYAGNKQGRPEVSGITQDELAAFIGGARASCNRLFGIWEELQYITRVGRRVEILNIDALRDIADSVAPKPVGTTSNQRALIMT